MAGAAFELEIVGLEAAEAALARFARPALRAEALALVGGLMESQTRLRFQTKVGPDGDPWEEWSERYAASRHRGHSLLMSSGALLDDMAFRIEGESVSIGSNLVYAAIQQEGGLSSMPPGPAAVPARPYLGVSPENLAEIDREITGWLGSLVH